MNAETSELDFTSRVAGWINLTLDRDPSLPFKEARCERKAPGSRKPRDFSLIDKSGKIALTGEVRLAFARDGATPRNEALVKNAREKAELAGVRYFFTWNVNEMLLWETFAPGTHEQERNYRRWVVTDVRTAEDLDNPIVQKQVQRWVASFLSEYAQIYLGEARIGALAPDEKFIDTLESFLSRPIHLTLEELDGRSRDRRFKAELDAWMRDKLGFVLSEEPQTVRDNIERAAKSACYVLVNRLVFYEAMMKRYGRSLPLLEVPRHLGSGDELRTHLLGIFQRAVEVTADYETVFGEDPRELGGRIPFYSDDAVVHWRELVRGIHRFDFTKLNYDVIGRIFERLVGPEERHKYGQFFTRPDVVDLINAFCIGAADARVMDPACGAGTFLVRAYARKRELNPSRGHGDILRDLFGVDFSTFATHLCTINLATRDLVNEENYPQVARSDFFDVKRGEALVLLPIHAPIAAARGKGTEGARPVTVPELDAVVSNPPYMRQEDIRSEKPLRGEGPRAGTKEHYQALAQKEGNISLSGRSDLHCYFWPHASTFLRDGGYLGFLTPSQWLDVEYGFRLQEFLLANFQILAVIESLDEPWFEGARVQTAITILRKEADEPARMDNTVRFVQLRRAIKELLSNDGTEAGRQLAAESLRDEVLGLSEDTVNARYRARLVQQRQLWEDGVRLGGAMGKAKAAEYYGGKWGVHLRAPDLWFELQAETRKGWVPLSELAEVRRGITSGKDRFFFVRDVSGECLAEERDPRRFAERFGADRFSVEGGNVSLVRCGEKHGEIRPIESRFLEPEVHTLMELKRYTVTPEDCGRRILLVSEPKHKLRGTHVLRYIQWGESQGWHKGSTCAARVTANRAWYDLTGCGGGVLLWPLAQQYRHVAICNDDRVVSNKRLFDISPHNDVSKRVLGGVLNSTWVVLSKYQYGRPVGVEGNLDTEVVDVNMMLVPDPRRASESARRRVARAFESMKSRQLLQFLSPRRLRKMAYTLAGKLSELEKLPDKCELDMLDRRELDDAVLEMLGVRKKERRGELLEALYREMREMFEAIRQKEEKAAEFKKRAKRKTRLTARDIARQVLKDISEKEPRWLRSFDSFLPPGCELDEYPLPETGEPVHVSDMFESNGLRFGRKEFLSVRDRDQAELLFELWRTGIRGSVKVPRDAKVIAQVLREWLRFVADREARMRELAAERTADEDMQADIVEELTKLLAGA